MARELLIVPLGYGWARDRRGLIVADAQGEARISAAINYGINQELQNRDVLYGALPGVIPLACNGDSRMRLGDAMERTFTKFGILTERIVRGRPNVWGSYAEADEGLRLAEEMHRAAVFVTSTYHVPRLLLVCREILGYHTYRRKLSWEMLNVLGCGNQHASQYDLLVEPVKYTGQALRIPLGRFMPKTLGGRL